MSDRSLIPKLIEKLLTLTAEHKIEWAETVSENDFQATVGQYVVTIRRTRHQNSWDAWDYAIRVDNEAGVSIDEATDDSFDASFLIAGNSPFKAMELLYDEARRSARNVDQALTELLASLDSL